MPNSDTPNASRVANDPRVVEGRFSHCLEGLVVSADCLGQTYGTVIGQQPLTINMPSLPSARDTLPDLVGPETHHPYSPRSSKPADWGCLTSYASGGRARSAEIEALQFAFEAAGTDEEVSEVCQRIESDLDSWWERVSMWLDTYTELDILRHSSRRPAILGQRLHAYIRNADGEVGPVNWTVTVALPFSRSIRVPDHVTLTRCFELAGAGTVLPVEWQYLREARSWLNARQTRRAVIDACTAAEIALENQVRGLLGTTDGAFVHELLSRCAGIADRATLVRKLGGTDATASRKHVEDNLAKVRNQAVHAGSEPSQEEANRALEAAIEVVSRFLPRERLHEL